VGADDARRPGRARLIAGSVAERVVDVGTLCDHEPGIGSEKGSAVPLSEDEQRILTEIEQHLYASDPALARQVGSTTVYTAALRGARFGAIGLVFGLVLAILLLQVNYVVSFVAGFGLMLASAWHLQRNLRRLGRTGFEQVSRSLRVTSLRDYLNQAGERARDRFRRDDEVDEE